MNRSLMRQTLVACACLAASLACAQSFTASALLEKVSRTGLIKIGHRESSIPFSYYDDKQTVVGYSNDLAMAVVKDIGAALGRRDLRAIFIPVNSQNRIPLLLNGSVDLECGSTTHNKERARQVAFSTTIFVTNTKTLVKAGAPYRALSDLNRRNVVVTAGTSAERMLKRYNNEKALNMRILTARDHSESFLMLASGRAEGFVMDDALLYGERAKSGKPDSWRVIGPTLAREAYGCMLRREDPAFKRLVDIAVTKALQGQAGRALYEKWFLSPIPPRHVNLNWPPSADILSLYEHPHDRPLD